MPEESSQIQRDGRAGGGAADDDPTASAQRALRIHPGLLAHAVDHDVGAATSGEAPHLRTTSSRPWFSATAAPSCRARSSLASLAAGDDRARRRAG